ncbi:hypothetical protein SAMD00019534_042830 [Acytostelium subglobosum LB1]|uniref:hypothetical protein n=1 Tax=Acytostelium subglobosum LB1 TaxID=1410327 RepID=UPI0006451918|nr:hypothetical protein SAMD00019534_042830 [Acytostelium subglobosum LB1]GAM21108.1 hypothetical protein SAMD00019534_042830 [Acytostelium subglobosum LB1]|eukprot:XP_012756242.1 hypothetical protein SAMD00019534_042830 [Acytostelium subglobosum LB1]
MNSKDNSNIGDEPYLSIPDSEIVVPLAIDSFLRKKLKEQTLVDCEVPVKEFARCTEDKLLSVIWECKELQQKMKDCLSAHTTPERLMELKREWINHTKKKMYEKKMKDEVLTTSMSSDDKQSK